MIARTALHTRLEKRNEYRLGIRMADKNRNAPNAEGNAPNPPRPASPIVINIQLIMETSRSCFNFHTTLAIKNRDAKRKNTLTLLWTISVLPNGFANGNTTRLYPIP